MANAVAETVCDNDPLQPPAAAETIFGGQLDKACAYHRLLATDGHTRGFIGPREIPRLWSRHLLNCAVTQELFADGTRLVDIGSGAGLPGIALAIARPDVSVTLVESLLKRSVFLNEAVAALELDNVTVIRGRAEDPAVVAAAGGADYATSRAVAPLGKLAVWSLPLVKKGGHLVALKGESVQEEITRDRSQITAAGGGRPTVATVGVGMVDEPATVVDIERVR
ncbi:16S rRNA (guanine(527)-N(7))-methyltransferase RsmG [Corynebacterium sp. CCM 8862]|uniref:Ribosomal RNA small subunit methyltransferase G n=1 Tax=Corynebacterium mendelii TaxID=2765362 RepID=A0A939IXQ6_9CORY|nr:16S rRNA (guanine(527)-N(7))-methyltransferase RsmG [Corynebacterium mendelii]